MIKKIGITEGSDAALDLRWQKWVNDNKPAILITKDPIVLFNILQKMDETKFNIITHLTITGNGGTILEPNVKPYKESLPYLQKFIELLGKDRVILRIDPVIPVMPYIENSYNVLEEANKMLGDDMCRVKISIYDNYKHTAKRLKDEGIDFGYEGFHYSLKARKFIWRNMGCPETCGEPGLPQTPCISEIECKVLGVEPGISEKWQRKDCGCLNNKHELTPVKEPCKHNCKYCFWKNK